LKRLIALFLCWIAYLTILINVFFIGLAGEGLLLGMLEGVHRVVLVKRGGCWGECQIQIRLQLAQILEVGVDFIHKVVGGVPRGVAGFCMRVFLPHLRLIIRLILTMLLLTIIYYALMLIPFLE
jgi:hypothetical protein